MDTTPIILDVPGVGGTLGKLRRSSEGMVIAQFPWLKAVQRQKLQCCV